MHNVTDNDIDKLFREAADRNVPEFDPRDWEDMASRLDHEDRSATMRGNTLYTLLFLLLINTLLPPWGQRENIQSASMFQTQKSTEDSDVKQAQEMTSSETESIPKDGVIANPKVQDNNNGTNDETIENELQLSLRHITPRQETKKTNRDINKTADRKTAFEKYNSDDNNEEKVLTLAQPENSTETQPSITGQSFSSLDETNTLRKEVDVLSAPVNGAIISINGESSKDINPTKITSSYNLAPYERSALIGKVTEADSVIKPVEQIEGDSEQPTTVIKPDPRTTQRWFLKVPVSPDFSAIDYADLGDPGINIGFLGEYNVTTHLSVSTGAIWSKKLYSSENPDKSYSSGNWTGKASKLDGDCRVLDIPINFTYYIFPHRRTNLFVSLGTSSYIMLKEQYVYTVWANQKEYQYEETFSNENNEWFSMLNLSIGIQQRLGNRFFAQAEPFLKAPMAGVGEGKVNLMSTGIFFSLKYSLNK